MTPYIQSDSRGQRFVLTDEASLDDAQASGRWIASLDPVEREP